MRVCGTADIREWTPERPPDVMVSNAVLQWVPGHDSLLRPVLALLDDEGAADFTEEYGERVRGAYHHYPFGVIFPFRRVFVVARRRD